MVIRLLKCIEKQVFKNLLKNITMHVSKKSKMVTSKLLKLLVIKMVKKTKKTTKI